MSSIKIAHLTSAHHRTDIRIFHKECTSLRKKYSISLIVADGEGDTIQNGITIYDVGKPKGRLDRFRNCTNQVYQKALVLDVDLYHFHDPELLPVGLKLKGKGKKVIYDAHEDVPRQLMGKPYLNKFAKPIVSKSFNWYEDRVAKKLDGIITATPYIAARFQKLNSDVLDINNFPVLGELDSKIAWNKKEKAVCYIGGVSRIRGIKELVQSMSYVADETMLLLAGRFNENEFEKEVKNLETWPKVNDFGLVNRAMVRTVLSKSLAGIVTFLPLPNHVDAQPNKMFEYMSAGIPVIGSHFHLWKEIIEKNNCGICVNPQNPKAIADAINYLIKNPKIAQKMGENGRQAVFQKYNWQNEEQKLFQFYEKILAN